MPVTGLRERANASRARFFRARYTLPLLRCGRALLSCRGPSRADATRAHFTCARIAYTAAASYFDLSRAFGTDAHARFSRARNSFRLHRCDRIAFACRGPSQANTLHSRLFRARSNPPPAPLRLNRFFLSRTLANGRTMCSSLSCEKCPPLTPPQPRRFDLSRTLARTDAPRAFLSRKIIPSSCARAAFVLSRAFAQRTHGALVSLVREISLVVRALRGGRHAVQSALLRPAWEAPENEKMKTASGAAHMRPMPSRKRCFRPQ